MASTNDLAKAFRESTYFQWWQKTLRQRREAHLRILPATSRESAMRDGALAELSWLLSAPDVLVHVEAAKRAEAEERRVNPAGFPDGYTDDDELVN